MDKPNILVSHDFNLVDKTEPAQIVAELFLGHILVKSTDVYIPARIALLDAERNLAWHRAGFPPTNLQFLPMQRQLLDRCVGMEGCRGCTVEERQEHTGLLRQNADRLKRAEVDEIEELID